MSEQARFLLINGSHEDHWHRVLEEALAGLGALQIETEENAFKIDQFGSYALLIIDATVVENVPALVANIRDKRSNARIVVATASPTWMRAREVFQAGAIDYIRKSIDREEMFAAICTALDKVLPSTLNL